MPEEKQKKLAVVTGGAGFIGSFLCAELLKKNYRVICIDDFTTGHVRNIDPFLRSVDFQFLKVNINERFDLERFPELEPFKIQFTGVDEIYHLAVPTSIKNFDTLKKNTLLTSSAGTQNILELAVKYNSKVLLASSSVVYGPRTEDHKIFKESDIGCVDHLNPRSCYDEGRRFAETMFYTYGDVHKLDYKIARIFRTYGPHMPLFDGHQIPDFVLQALNGEDVVVNGTEEFKTSVVYVTDVVDGMLRLMGYQGEERVMNFGSDLDLKLVEIAQKVIDLTGSSSKLRFEEQLAFLSELGLPDISLAKEKLGWLPVVQLEHGLQKTVEYIRANKILLTGEGN
ncbi:NAD-dependent epimerase/dehydratase family protein [Candidatus Uhrbacteria bacterium]|jgi:UDP-glucuronate decarboxylase|nr:NAD-dependent epimerase/dehydratase family protein [Candidatus Uhrbacteria bacterium]MBT7717572.1 NAD-dependent epimerase/dehydratase family protein [Candidatus Uhrbacteria bacterium]